MKLLKKFSINDMILNVDIENNIILKVRNKLMNNNVDNFSVAIALVNRKIAELNIKLSLNKTVKLDEELKKYLELKRKIYDGDTLLIKKIVDGEII